MLICIFVNAIISLMVLGILNSLSVQAETMSAIERHEEAGYLADAGLQHAVSVLQSDPKSLGLRPVIGATTDPVKLPSKSEPVVLSRAVIRPVIQQTVKAELKWDDTGSAISTGVRRGYSVTIVIDEKNRATISSDGYVDSVRSRRTVTVNQGG